MKVTLRADTVNDSHIRITVFVNGGNCGQLTLRTSEGLNFHHIVAMGCCDGIDSFVSKGQWTMDAND